MIVVEIDNACAVCGKETPPKITKPCKYCSLYCRRKAFRTRHKSEIQKFMGEYYLKNKLKLNKRKSWRFGILKRDNFTCQYCGRKAPEVALEVDHVIPKSKKGKDVDENYVTSCWECNRGKAGSLIEKLAS